MHTLDIDDETFERLQQQAISRGLDVQTFIAEVAWQVESVAQAPLKGVKKFLAHVKERDTPSKCGVDWSRESIYD